MPLITTTDRTVPVTVQARTPAPPTATFDVVAPIDLPGVFRPWGPFPGVADVADQPPSWDRVGATRTPRLTDGTAVTERITEYRAGSSFAYEITGFTNVLGRLVAGVRGEWTFTPDGEGTLVRWTYEFQSRRARLPLVRFVLAPAWRHYMARGLAAAIAEVERDIR